MVFVSPDLAEALAISGAEDTDAAVTTEANLNDDDTGTTATSEIRTGMACYKITHDLGFALAGLDSLSIRAFDGDIMDLGDAIIYPYSSGDVDVVTGNEQTLVIADNGAYDTLVLSSAFIGDLQDVGTNQISIRLAYDGVIRGRFNEIQIEFAEAAAVHLPPDLAHRPQHQTVMAR